MQDHIQQLSIQLEHNPEIGGESDGSEESSVFAEIIQQK
jgi:hypothetical protein